VSRAVLDMQLVITTELTKHYNGLSWIGKTVLHQSLEILHETQLCPNTLRV